MRYKGALTAILFVAFMGNALAADVRVEVVNETIQEPMASYPLSLAIGRDAPGGGFEAERTLEFRTGPGGLFQGEVEMAPGEELLAEVNYRGIAYRSGPLEARAGMDGLSLRLSVFELTDSSRDVLVSERTLVLMPSNERHIQVFETLVVENRGDRTYIGRFSDEMEVTQVLYVPMPRGYMLTGISGVPPSKVLSLNRGLVTRSEIVPGAYEVSMSYLVSSDTGFFDFSLLESEDAPKTGKVILLFPETSGWEVKASGLAHAGGRRMGGRVFSGWEGTAGSVTRIKVYGPTYVDTTRLWAILLAMVFITSLGGLYLVKGRVRLWSLERERNRLESLLSRFNEETGDGEARRYYSPFVITIEGRLRELHRRLDS